MEDDRQLVRIICCYNEDCSLSIRGSKIVLVVADRRDRYQYWIKDDRHHTRRKDSEGQPAFALVNHATGEAIKHCPDSDPLPLVQYNPDSVDEVLWSMPKDMKQGFTNIRRMDDISLLFTALENRVHEARLIRLRRFAALDNDNNSCQRWKIVPYADNLCMELGHCRPSQPTVKIYCQTKVGYNLTIFNDTVMLAPDNPADKYQHWIKESTYCEHVRDEEKRPAFALVNKATGKAIKHTFAPLHLVRLAPLDKNYLDASALWTEGSDVGNGFREIRMVNNLSWVFDAHDLQYQDWALLSILRKTDHTNQRWKIEVIK
ncbi:ricin B-like lectin R40C1 [Carex rostrata]